LSSGITKSFTLKGRLGKGYQDNRNRLVARRGPG
jgi:hypothetical protein